MTNQAQTTEVKLQALLLADQIYRDQGTGKYVIAGTFHQLNAAAFPATFSRTIGIFAAISGFNGDVGIDLEFVDAASGDVLIRTHSMSIFSADSDEPVEFAVEIPPLPLPHAGRYLFRLLVGGTLVGTAGLMVCGPPTQG